MKNTVSVLARTLAAAKLQLTSSPIWSPRVFLQLDSDASNTAYVGGSDLDATSAATLRATCWFTLTAGQVVELPGSVLDGLNRESFRLSDVYVYGSGNDVIRATYATRAQ